MLEEVRLYYFQFSKLMGKSDSYIKEAYDEFKVLANLVVGSFFKNQKFNFKFYTFILNLIFNYYLMNKKGGGVKIPRGST